MIHSPSRRPHLRATENSRDEPEQSVPQPPHGPFGRYGNDRSRSQLLIHRFRIGLPDIGSFPESALRPSLLNDRLNIIPVGIQNERCKISIMVERSGTGGTIVTPAVSQTGLMECYDGLRAWRSKRDMRLRCWTVLLGDPEKRLSVAPIACRMIAVGIQSLEAQWGKQEIIECSRNPKIGHRQSNMVQHCSFQSLPITRCPIP